MPKSPKFFYPHRQWFSYNNRSYLLVCSLLIGIVTYSFGLVFVLRSSFGFRCRHAEPRSVKVVWERSVIGHGGGIGDGNRVAVAGDQNRHKVMGFVGIQTGFGSAGRRRSLRKTWIPSDFEGLKRLEKTTGLAFRFVIGRTHDESKMAQLRDEVAEYDDFLLLDIEEQYSMLPHKTLAFFKAAYGLYDAEFYVKADDDIYLRPDRLSLLLKKERNHPLIYIGCMKKGQVFTNPKIKWFEPQSHLLGREYFLHAYGPIYALSADLVTSLVALKNDSFRMFSNEDVTIGSWMLAMNVHHEDCRLLCEPQCTLSSVAVWDIPKCSGLCNPEKKLLRLHEQDVCSKSPAMTPEK